MEGQDTLISVVNSAVWKNVVATFSCIIFFRFVAMVVEYQATAAKEKKEPARIAVLTMLLHSSHVPLLLNSSSAQLRNKQKLRSSAVAPSGQVAHSFAAVGLAFPTLHA